MDNKSNFSKSFEFKKISKEINKFWSLKMKKFKVENIIFVPYNGNIGYNDLDTNKLLITADIISKQKLTNGEKSYLVPILNINYNTKSVYNSENGEQVLYQKYKNFYKHCQFLGIQFAISYKGFFEISFHKEVLQQINTLQKKGILTNTYSVRQRSIASQSVLTNEEIEYKKQEIKNLYIKFFVEAKKHVIVSHIENPIYFFGIVAILVHPKDKRYKQFIGKNVVLPIVNKGIPVIGDDTVDTIVGSGTIALIPGHNSAHLILAKKHNLPTDIFSVDNQGLLTKHSKQFVGENAKDFEGNIIRFLDDIGNLKEIKNKTKDLIYEKQTGDIALYKASLQRIFQLPEFFAYPNIDYNVLPNKFKEDINELFYKRKKRCISRQFKNLYQIPLFQDKSGEKYFLNLDKFFENFADKNIKKNIILTIFLIVGYLHGYWNEVFSISSIINISKQKKSKKDKKNLGEIILNYILSQINNFEEVTKKFYTQEYKEFTELLKKEFVDTEEIETMILYFENSFAIKTHDNDIAQINRTEVFEIQEGIEKTQTISKDDIYAIDHKLLGIIQSDIIAKKFGVENNYELCFDKESQDNAILLHQYKCYDKNDKNINVYYTSDDLENKEQTKISIYQYKEAFDGDTVRLFCLFTNTLEDQNLEEKEKYNIKNIEKYNFLIKKIRNASRFIIMNCETKQEEIDNNLLDIKDKRILNKYTEMTKNYKNYYQKNLNLNVLKEIIETICFDFFDNYMGITKKELTDNKKLVLNILLKQSLKLLFPIIPFITQKIRNTISKENISDINNIYTIDKEIDYNFVLCMNIIKVYNKRRYKHQGLNKVKFYLKGNPNITKIMKENIDTLNSTIKRCKIEYTNDDLPGDCLEKETIIDIYLGLKLEELKKENDLILEDVESLLKEKKQKLQKIREIIQIIQPEEIAMRNQYTKQLEELKEEIDELEIKYSKIKFLQKNS